MSKDEDEFSDPDVETREEEEEEAEEFSDCDVETREEEEEEEEGGGGGFSSVFEVETLAEEEE